MEEIRNIIIEFLIEVYNGPSHQYTWFINNEPDSGILGTINKLKPEEASTPIIENGTTIAAHIEHLRWTLNKTNSLLRGKHSTMNWSESWQIRKVDSTQWKLLVENLMEEFKTLIRSLSSVNSWASDEQLKEVLALIPHAAYHLGAIRQMNLILKEDAL
ncbi:MAG: hypothetical protein ABSA11_16480 [Candidatus Bathyarchaeia archaeon]|jgi:hypothetical protein